MVPPAIAVAAAAARRAPPLLALIPNRHLRPFSPLGPLGPLAPHRFSPLRDPCLNSFNLLRLDTFTTFPSTRTSLQSRSLQSRACMAPPESLICAEAPAIGGGDGGDAESRAIPWGHPERLDLAMGSLVDDKTRLRKDVKKALRGLTEEQRAAEDVAVQRHVLQADWFRSAQRVAAYISCRKLREVETADVISDLLGRGASLFVPRVMDSESHMVMLKINSVDVVGEGGGQGGGERDREAVKTQEQGAGADAAGDLERNGMGILEPTLTLTDGRPRSDVYSEQQPLDLILVPGLAFDRSGGRLGRGGGYYDVFLSQYLEHAQAKKWKQPLIVALAYKAQILSLPLPMETSDVPVSGIVCADGFLAPH
ncbi:unnamed protein product [Closterium sp. Yama58-4]|nr:unnamed protein product [Closterium sp. Yama58-4]